MENANGEESRSSMAVANGEDENSTILRRRRHPEHPPYALMIGDAIRSLNSAQGSTMESISEHIKANYDQLPPAHDKFLPYYLYKLVAQGEFFRGHGGRYLLAAPLQVLDPDAINFEPSGLKQEPRCDLAADGEAALLPIDCGDNFAVQVQAMAQNSKACAVAFLHKPMPKRRGRPPLLYKRRGRPPKKKAFDYDGSCRELALVQPEPIKGKKKSVDVAKSVAKRSGMPPSTPRGRGSPPLKKRGRGRPPLKGSVSPPLKRRGRPLLRKGETLAIEGVKEAGGNNDSVVKLRENNVDIGEGVKARPKKGLGKPQKRKLEPLESNEEAMAPNENIVKPIGINDGGDGVKSTPRKKLKRPPKGNLKAMDSSETAIVLYDNAVKPTGDKGDEGEGLNPVTKKRRGRPPKNKLEPMFSTMAAIALNDNVKPTENNDGDGGEEVKTTTKKKVGRRPKRKLEAMASTKSTIAPNGNVVKPTEDNIDDGGEEVNPAAKKKLERLPKRNLEPLDSTEEVVAHNDDVVKLKENHEDGGEGIDLAVKEKLGEPQNLRSEPMDTGKEIIAHDDNFAMQGLDAPKPIGDGHDGEDSSKSVPKVKGRPVKRSHESNKSSNEEEIVASSVEKSNMESSSSVPKRRGRPPKPKPELVVAP